MSQSVHGFPAPLPFSVDFVVYSNEDIGMTAALAVGVNDVFAFAMPYPASMDLMTQSMVVWAMEFVVQKNSYDGGTGNVEALNAFLSMLDREFAATFIGVGVDAEDENIKAQFARNIYFGGNTAQEVATASVEGGTRVNDAQIDALYFPPVPLDLITPLYIQLVNQSSNETLATNVVAAANFTTFERVNIIPWFTIRNLSPAELAFRNVQLRFQRLDS